MFSLSSWARFRHGENFRRVKRFCLFVGYPRSGHSIVGALLNSHRHVVISHELNAPTLIIQGCTRDQLYARILARAYWFNLRGNASNYKYQVPNEWQGRFEALQVIGDKRGGAASRCIAEYPDFLKRLRELVQVPVCLVHVIRNPFDNISAISIWNKMPLETSIDFYFQHCQVTSALNQTRNPEEFLNIHHERMIDDPGSALSELCSFLGIECPQDYLGNCCSIVYGTPSITRRKVSWPAQLVRDVESRMRRYPFLKDYTFK